MKSWDPEANHIFSHAVEIESPIDRANYIERACGENSSLRERVEGMLRTHEETPNFLVHPAAGSDIHINDLLAPTQFSHRSELDSDHVHSIFDSFRQRLPGLGRVLLQQQKDSSGPVVRPNSPELPLNKWVGRYTLDGEIARGGMGAIFRGRDTDLGRDIAIKVLLNSHLETPEIFERFIEEAQIGGQLQHPGIAPIYELGQFEDGRPFFSMKLVKGETLAAVLADRKSAVDDRVRLLGVFEQICQTMSYAHSRGVVHRDLKPANVMVGMFGEVQVMDWGLAKVLAVGGIADERKSLTTQRELSLIRTLRSGDSTNPGSDGSNTRLGSVLGTPAYMAPEQARGEIDNLDERSDVFGLGAILCEILTGSPPYVGKSGNDVFLAASQGNLNSCFDRLNACDVDKELHDLVLDCLAIESKDRLRDASAVAQRISDYLASVESRLREAEVKMAAEKARGDEAVKTSKAERERRNSVYALAGSILLSLSLAGYALNWFKQRERSKVHANTEVINETLREVERLRAEAESANENSVLAMWAAAVAEAQKASALSLQGAVPTDLVARTENVLDEVRQRADTVNQELQRQADQNELIARLDEIRQRSSESEETTTFNFVSAEESYEEAFASADLDVLAMVPTQAALRIQESPIREELIVALDQWARVSPAHFDRRAKIRRVADIADENPWRRKLRTAVATNDSSSLRELRNNPQTSREPSAMLVSLGVALRDCGAVNESVDLLRESQLKDPNDFWLNLELGRSLAALGDNQSAIGFALAATALRPNSLGAFWDLANRYRDNDELDESARVFRRLCEVAPDEFFVRIAYSEVLELQGNLNQAILQSREAIRINTTNYGGHHRLGALLERVGLTDEAITAYSDAVNAMPENPVSYQPLIRLRQAQGNEEAVAHLQNQLLDVADKWKRNDNRAWAADAYRVAVQADPQSASAHVELGRLLYQSGNMEQAEDSLLSAINLDPEDLVASSLLDEIRQVRQIQPKLDDYLAGTLDLSDSEQLAAVRLLYLKRRYNQAAECCEHILSKSLDAQGSITAEVQYVGAKSAARASLGHGDSNETSENDSAQLRAWAFEWLQQALAVHEQHLLSDRLPERLAAIETLQQWRATPDLFAIHAPEAIEKLSEVERRRIESLWQRVDESLNSARLTHWEGLLQKEPTNEAIATKLAEAMLEIHHPNWLKLEPKEMNSSAGASFELLPDTSILVSGNNVDGDVYRIACETTSESISGLRIEALPHDSLPLGGPGRGVHAKHETGNFVVSLTVLAKDIDSDEADTLEYSAVWADQSHHAYPINTGGYWNLGAWEAGMGQGKPHEAIFELSSGIQSNQPTTLLFEMRFQADPAYLTNLGRFRLSLTKDPLHLSYRFTDNGFVKLALAYQIIGAEAKLLDLLERTPKVAEMIGDWHLEHGQSQDAIKYFELIDEPASAGLLSKRAECYAKLGLGDKAASDWSTLLEQMPFGDGASSDRSQLLSRILHHYSNEFDTLLKLRPDDWQLRVTHGRQLVRRSDWQGARSVYAAIIEECPPGEAWFEYLAILLLLDDEQEYRSTVSRFAEITNGSQDAFVQYCLARGASLGEEPPIDSEALLNWANAAVNAERTGWYLHALSMAQLRTGLLSEARETNELASKSNWETGLGSIELVASIIHSLSGDSTASQRHLDAALAHMNALRSKAKGEEVPVASPDWLEMNVLVQVLNHNGVEVPTTVID